MNPTRRIRNEKALLTAPEMVESGKEQKELKFQSIHCKDRSGSDQHVFLLGWRRGQGWEGRREHRPEFEIKINYKPSVHIRTQHGPLTNSNTQNPSTQPFMHLIR
jgi:hypothetical protein